MPSSENRVVIACAGSGKTTRLVNESLASRDRRVAIVTYTNNNIREIVKRFGELNSGVPKNVDVLTWFGFMLRECARPYQRSVYAEKRIESMLFVNEQSVRYIPETDTRRHYFANGEFIYSDKIAKFVVNCEEESHHRVTARLGQIYTDIFIDEFQDLAGWDLELIKVLLQSGDEMGRRTFLAADEASEAIHPHVAMTPSSRSVDLCFVLRTGLARQASGDHHCNSS